MTDEFNPYQQWLGLPPSTTSPDHYALLGITKSVSDPADVRRAAVQRKSQVRSCRPGAHAAAWGRLLDELDAAQRCLCDPQSRTAYDAELASAIENSAPPCDPEPAAGPSHLAPVRNPMPPIWGMRAPAAAPQQSAASPVEAPREMPGIQPPLAHVVAEGVANAPLIMPVNLGIAATEQQVDAVAPIDEKPIAWQYDGSFIVPAAVASGPAAQLLPPAVAYGVQTLAPHEAPPLAPPPPPVPPPPGKVGPAPRHATQVSNREAERSPSLSPGTLASFAAIGLAILLLGGAIVLLWQQKPDNSLGTNNNSELAKAAANTAARAPQSQPDLEGTTDPQPPANPGPSAPPGDPPPSEPPSTNPPVPAPPPVANPPSSPPMPTPPPPAPPMAPSTEQTMRVREALLRTRKLLAERDLSAAAATIKEAEVLAGDGPLAETTAPTAALTHYVNEFWKAVRTAIPKLAGSEIAIGETRVFVIEGDAERVLIRMAGQNREFTTKNMPAGLARRIAETWLEKSATSKAIVGAFLAVDPTMLSNDGREKARQLWKEAAAGGIDVKDLLRVLDEPQQ